MPHVERSEEQCRSSAATSSHQRGPWRARRAGHSCWVSPALGWDPHWGKGCGHQAAPPRGPRSIRGVSARASTVPDAGGEGAVGVSRLRSTARLRRRDFTKKGAWSTSAHRERRGCVGSAGSPDARQRRRGQETGSGGLRAGCQPPWGRWAAHGRARRRQHGAKPGLWRLPEIASSAAAPSPRSPRHRGLCGERTVPCACSAAAPRHCWPETPPPRGFCRG